MEQTKLKVGEIVQINPALESPFAACFMVVTEPKSWGAQGYVPSLGEGGERGGIAFFRAKWEDMDPTGGMAAWINGGREDNDDESTRAPDASVAMAVREALVEKP